jgi:hypothetical protein
VTVPAVSSGAVAVSSAGALGGADCEVVGSGLLAQPMNALSSLAFVAGGAWLLWRAAKGAGPGRRRLAAAGALQVVVGIGSVLFHGSMGPAAPLLHDSSFLALLLLAGAIHLADLAAVDASPLWMPRWEVTTFAGLVPVAALSTLGPGWVTGLGAVLVTTAFVGEVRLRRHQPRLPRQRRDLAVSTVLLGAAVAMYVLGRTGGPWCDPAALWQPHAAWHVLAAAAATVYAASTWGLAGRSRTE